MSPVYLPFLFSDRKLECYQDKMVLTIHYDPNKDNGNYTLDGYNTMMMNGTTMYNNSMMMMNSSSCKAEFYNCTTVITTRYDECGTVVMSNLDHIVYMNSATNMLKEEPGNMGITRDSYDKIEMKCIFNKTHVTSVEGGFKAYIDTVTAVEGNFRTL